MIETVVQWFSQNWLPLANVIMIDLVLAGDNAIVVGLAAAQVAPELRTRVIFWGIAGAVVLRIAFAAVTAQLLQITGILLFGGILLLYVCWKMFWQIKEHSTETQLHSLGAAAADSSSVAQAKHMSFWAAVWQIIIADVSMSLDNVLAVAGAAKGSTEVLVIGLAIAIVLMAVASHFIAKLLARYTWISWIGLLIILYVALDMTLHGTSDVACKFGDFACDGGVLKWARTQIGF